MLISSKVHEVKFDFKDRSMRSTLQNTCTVSEVAAITCDLNYTTQLGFEPYICWAT